MNLNTKLRYGLRAILYIYRKDDKFATISEISEKEKISKRYLENIFYNLKKGGIIESKKGKMGGFYAKKKPSEITVYDIFKLLIGDIQIVECLNNVFNCEKKDFCSTKKLFGELNDIIIKFFKGKTIEELMKS